MADKTKTTFSTESAAVVLASARFVLLELSDDKLLSVDGAWALMEKAVKGA